MTLGPLALDSSERPLIIEVFVISGASSFHGREGMSSDILYSSVCHQRRPTLLAVPLKVWIKFYPNKCDFFSLGVFAGV